MSGIKTAEILCVGTELLLGDIVNTNAAFLSRGLAELGIRTCRHTAVGDEPSRLRSAFTAALDSYDLVITSGGLGPTYDDLTKETIADVLGLPLELDSDVLCRIEEYFQRTGRVMTENNRKQAMVPHGATVLRNDYGTAPAVAIRDEKRNKTVIMLPGVPKELMPIFSEQAVPYLKSLLDSSAIISKNVYIFGIGESAVEDKLGTLLTASTNPSVAPYCKAGEVRLRVTAESQSAATASRMCDEVIERIRAGEVGEYIYGIDVDTLENALVELLHKTSLTLCCAESCTGGLIAERITSVAGCSDVFAGGCVTYTNKIKQELLGVSAKTLDEFGAVSAETAMEMARGARQRLGTDIAVSATGIAGPSGGTEQAPVGTVFIGLSSKQGETFRRLSLSSMRSREYIREVSASNALDMAIRAVKALTKN